MRPLEALATYLGALTLATPGVDLFLRPLDQPDALVALIEYGGGEGGYRNERGLPFDERPRFQLMVRGRTYDATEARARAIHDALHMMHRTEQGTRFFKVRALSRPYYLRRDESDRIVFTCNFEIHSLAN